MKSVIDQVFRHRKIDLTGGDLGLHRLGFGDITPLDRARNHLRDIYLKEVIILFYGYWTPRLLSDRWRALRRPSITYVVSDPEWVGRIGVKWIESFVIEADGLPRNVT